MYSNGMNEDRMQYAIHVSPYVWNVWSWVLSECCRNRSATITVRGDIDLKGASWRMNIPAEDIKRGLELLAEIGYVSTDGGSITVNKWEELQSEYCQKVKRVEKKRVEEKRDDRQTPDSVGTKSDIEENTPLMVRLNAMFRRKPTTKMNAKELKALAALIGPDGTAPEDFELVEDFHLHYTLPPDGYNPRRRDLLTLLNNWNGECDKARQWKAGAYNRPSTSSGLSSKRPLPAATTKEEIAKRMGTHKEY